MNKLAILLTFFHMSCAMLVLGEETLLSTQMAETKRALEDFEKGIITLDEATAREGPTTVANVINYYQAHSNEVTLKMLLPISRCYAVAIKGPEAAALAQKYLNVHSNDYRAWDILAAAKIITKSYPEALAACTNSVKYGGEKNLVGLGMLALELGRDDVIESMVIPRVLSLKEAKDDLEIWRQRMRFLVLYSVIKKKGALYVKTLQGLTAAEIWPDQDFRRYVLDGCDLFELGQTEDLCRELKELGRGTSNKREKTQSE